MLVTKQHRNVDVAAATGKRALRKSRSLISFIHSPPPLSMNHGMTQRLCLVKVNVGGGRVAFSITEIRGGKTEDNHH